MHHRKRHIIQMMLKRSKISPVLGLLGARQVGKSTFLRQEWQDAIKAKYLTFDN